MFSHALTIARFTLLESLRNRLLLLCLLIAASSFAMIEFIGELTITEHRVTQVALLAAFLRISAVVIVALFVVSGTVRELHDKTLEMILAMPVRRSTYYLGKLGGFTGVAFLVSLIFSVLLFFYTNTGSLPVWSLSLFLELVLVVSLSLVMLFTFSQIPTALTAVLLVYGAARIMTSIYLMAKFPLVAQDTLAQQFMSGFITLLTWLLPDLQAFTQTDWLVYSSAGWNVLLPVAGQTAVYLLFLSFLALFDFYRKNF